MRIAYLSLDEVNQDFAVELAEFFGATVYPVSPRDEPLDGRFDAVLFDLDSLRWHGSRAILSEDLLSGLTCGRIAVHGYSLSGDQAMALRNKGIAVFERLGADVFRSLRWPNRDP
jgi:hypothetical protein